VRYLISKGADVSIEDECGRTPLFIAAGLGNWDMVEIILAACRTVDTRFVV
jgi:ankyrin repeat protein